MEVIVQRLAEISVTAGIVVLGVCLVRLLCKKAPKWIAVLLWGLVGLRLLLPFSIESPVSVVPSVDLPRIEQTVLPQVGEKTPIKVVTDPTDTKPIPDNAVVDTSDTAPSVIAKPTVSFWQVASIVWIVGVAGMLAYAAATYCAVRRRVRAATKEEDGVYRSEAVGSPFILGIFRTRIYVPYTLQGEQLEAVLAHERAHIKRLDHIIKPFGFLLLSVYWFQPLLWLGYILLCRDVELACDERVVRSLSEEQRRGYSMALVTSAVGRHRVAACPLAFGEVAVKERVRSVMNYKKPAFWIVIAAVVLSTVAAICLLTDPLSTTPYSTLDGATLWVDAPGVMELDDGSPVMGLGGDSITLPEGEDYIMNREFPEAGKVYFTLVDSDDREMSATVTLNKDLYHNGRKVSKVNVSYWEPVTLNEKRDGSGMGVTLSISLPSTKENNYWYSHSDSTSVTRYANGNTVLYLYYKHFVLTDDGMVATNLSGECSYNWVKENDYMIADPVKKYTQGSYEWVDGTLVLTEDGGLTRYVFRVNADGSLTHLKKQLSRHKKAQSPVLANGLSLMKEYALEVVKNETRGCSYTLRDGQGRYLFTGESEIENLEIISYADGTVRLVREQPDRRYVAEHEWIDLQSGESRGVCCYGSSDHRFGGSGYVPLLCEKDGKVILKAQYSSWCGTAPPKNFLFELEGLSDLRHGAVKAIVDNGEIVIAYTDDNGNARVIAEELTDTKNGVSDPITRPLVTVTEFDADGKSITGSAQTVRYNQISAAYIRIGEEYVDLDKALSNGNLTVALLEEWLEQQIDGSLVCKETDGSVSGADAYQVHFHDGTDGYHTIHIVHYPSGGTEITVGYKVYHSPIMVSW